MKDVFGRECTQPPVERNGVAKRWWARTCVRLRQSEVRRLEISVQADEVRTRCFQQAPSTYPVDCCSWWWEDHLGQPASYNDHEVIHEARKAVIAEAQALGCWRLQEDNAYSLVFERREAGTAPT